MAKKKSIRKATTTSERRPQRGGGAGRQQHLKWLLEVTELPTAAGREDRVIAWVRAWAASRTNLSVTKDRAGNLLISQRVGLRGRKPLIFQAHMDHPALVVRRVIDAREVELEFRGGVGDAYFENAKIEVFDVRNRAHAATITHLDSQAKPFKLVRARLAKPAGEIVPGDVGRWRFAPASVQKIRRGMLHAHGCDDQAAVAAALSAFDVLRQQRGFEHVGVFLSRAEEIGFVGTIAACRDGTLSRDARVICLENSRSFAESPIGGGPIVRVGDKMSVFDPRLTNRISLIMTEHAKNNPAYKWQRKLMPGGTCEATVYSEYGYEATCLCLPLGNYHNQGDLDAVARGKRPARVKPEIISISDYHGLVEMLVVIAQQIDDAKFVTMKQRVDKYLDELGFVVFGDAEQSRETGSKVNKRVKKAAFALT
jgi:endoglucanase